MVVGLPGLLACGDDGADARCGAGLASAVPVGEDADAGRPPLQVLAQDPTFGACGVRVSDHIGHQNPIAVHHGSRHQAFNADGSLVMLRSGQLLRLRDSVIVSTLPAADSAWLWSPDEPDEAFALRGAQLVVHDARQNATRVVLSLPAPYQGWVPETATFGVDRTTHETLLVAVRDDGGKVLLRVDTARGALVPVLDVPRDELQAIPAPRWVSLLPGAQGSLVAWPREGEGARFAGVELFDREGRFLRQVTKDRPAGDVAEDGAGSLWFVYALAPHQGPVTHHHLVKTRLGSVRGVVGNGETLPLLTLDLERQVEVSCLAHGQDFCVFSTSADEGASAAPLAGELIKVDLGSTPDAPLFARLAQHRSRPAAVFAQPSSACPLSPTTVLPHPSLDRSGTRLLFGSNWGNNCFAELYMLQLP
ncbi:MAG: hypothetical protein KA712_14970 [Myxococcales bacterium]|nr:hypothetical protein [Myxococcales bacterium]